MARTPVKTDAETAAATKWALPTHQHRSRVKRDRLLKAGESVFAQHGFSDAHVSEIAQRAGCSIGSFYRRFKDKEALFLALQGDFSDKAHADIDRFFSHPACETAPLTAVCFRLIENSGSGALKNKGYYRALLEMSLRGINVWERMRELERYQAEKLMRLFVRRGHRGLRRDFIPAVNAAIRMILGNQMSMMLHGPGPFEHNDAESNCQLTRILMSVAGIPVDEDELKRIRAARSKRRI
jgi:AcrR family transcriptional regulator